MKVKQGLGGGMDRLLFVCTGNICRSPTAEAVFRHFVTQKGLQDRFFIDSAGTHGYHVGDAPDHRSIMTAMNRGVDMHELKARKVSARDFEKFDYILALDESHHAFLKNLKPKNGGGALMLFLDFHPEHKGKGVPDPYYGSGQDFETCYDLIEQGVQSLFDHIVKLRGYK
jgi:protein-tyrosine phosphatase